MVMKLSGGVSPKKPVQPKGGGSANWKALTTPSSIYSRGPIDPNSAAWAPLAPVTGVPRGSNTPTSGTGGGGTGGGGGGGGGFFPYGGGGSYDSNLGGGMMPQVEISEEDYLAGDGGFQAQSSALQSALERFLADSKFQRDTYDTDYKSSLRDLGYRESTDDWNWLDPLTASGRGYQSQLDDFGARGMIQSSGFANAQEDLARTLRQQLGAMQTNRTTFEQDMNNQVANYKAENKVAQQAARAEALQRRAAGFSL